MPCLSIPVILGTAREGRVSERVARFIMAKVTAMGHTPELVDVREYVTSPVTQASMSEERKAKWSEIVTNADAMIIISPEYNHSYPGELKLLLDENFKEYADLSVMIIGVSNGAFGGARMIEHIAPVMANFSMIFASALATPKAGELFRDDGALIDASYDAKAEKALAKLISYANRCIRKAGQ